MNRRVDTGIEGLNKLVKGGFLRGDSILLSGAPGAGKSIFSVQFLRVGIEHGEHGVLVTMGESKSQLIKHMDGFGWNLEGMIKSKKLSVIDATPIPKAASSTKFYVSDSPEMEFNTQSVSSLVMREIERIGASRVVVDSTTALLLAAPDDFTLRYELMAFSNMLQEMNCTSIITSEPINSRNPSRYGMEEFVTDGLIVLSYLFMDGEYKRVIKIPKMRGTNHGSEVYFFKIDKNGIAITARVKNSLEKAINQHLCQFYV